MTANIANIALILRKCKNNPGYYRPIDLTSVPEKIKEQVLDWKQILGHRNKSKVIVNSQVLAIGKSYLTSLTDFCYKITGYMGNGKVMDIIYFNFRRAFGTDPMIFLYQT